MRQVRPGLLRTLRQAQAVMSNMTASLLLLMPIAVGAQVASTRASDPDVGRMREVVDYFGDQGLFMGSVLVARGDDVLLDQGFGYANLEWGIPNSPTTKFRIGSITKQFTAAAILLLAEDGALALDDTVAEHWSDAPAAWDAVTIRHLLNHTSGIPSFTGFPDYQTRKLVDTPLEDTVRRFRDEPLEFMPGERFNYSNSGYLLLGYLVEQISGMGYDEFLRERILEPLGMHDSGVDSNAAILPERAAGYSPGPDGPVNAEFIHMSIPHGAGAMYSTTQDLYRWARALMGGEVVSAAQLAGMTTPVLNDYGFGLRISTASGQKQVSHGGGIEGFNTYLAYYPESEITVVVLGNINGNAPEQIADRLGTLAHGGSITLPAERSEISLPPAVLERLVGSYTLAPNLSLAISLRDGQLYAEPTGQRELPLFAESETLFFLRVVDAELEFEQSGDAPATAVTLHQGGRELRGTRVAEDEPAAP